MKKIVSILHIMIFIIILTSCGTQNTQILTTNYITYSLTKELVGDMANIDVVTPVSMDYHDYEPTSQDLIKISHADVFIYLGFAYETYLSEASLKTYRGEDSINIELINFTEDDHDHEEEHIHLHQEHDEKDHDHYHQEHYWTSPYYLKKMVQNLYNGLLNYKLDIEKLTQHKDKFIERIDRISIKLENVLSIYQGEPKIYFIGHNTFHPLESYFNLEIEVLIDAVNPSSELTSQQLITFLNDFKNSGVKFIFVEETFDPSWMTLFKEYIPDLIIYQLNGYHFIKEEDLKNNVSIIDLYERNINYIIDALLGDNL